MHRADGQTSRGADGGGKGADSRADGQTGPHEARTRGRAEEARTGPRRHRQGPARADGRTGGQVVGRMGGLGGRGLHCSDGRTGRTGPEEPRSTDGRTCRWAWVQKATFHKAGFTIGVPSSLASSERKCAGCLGVQ